MTYRCKQRIDKVEERRWPDSKQSNAYWIPIQPSYALGHVLNDQKLKLGYIIGQLARC